MFKKRSRKNRAKKKKALDLNNINDNLEALQDPPIPKATTSKATNLLQISEDTKNQLNGDLALQDSPLLKKREEPDSSHPEHHQHHHHHHHHHDHGLASSSATVTSIYQKTVNENSEKSKNTSEALIKNQLEQLKNEEEIKEKREKNAAKNAQKKTKLVSGFFGPRRQLKAIQHSNGIDYNPSRCKDYFETGYCVFGNSCIYIHDRTDYKSGYELDKDWDAMQRKKDEKRRKRLMKGEHVGLGDDSDEDNSSDSEEVEEYEEELQYGHIDEKCLICGEDYKFPSLLSCGHVFCDKCALEQHASEGTCFKCGKVTDGIFNDGTKLVKKMREERERVAKRKAKRKKKKGFGEAALYLRGMGGAGARGRGLGGGEGEGDEAAVVVDQGDYQRAMARIGGQKGGE